MEYTIIIHKAEEGGFWAEVPALSGCFSQGETVEETIVNTKDAIELHIACLMAVSYTHLTLPTKRIV